MNSAQAFAAADLGASSGRVILGRLTGGRFELTQMNRWLNGPVPSPVPGDHSIRWDNDMLTDQVRKGFDQALRQAGRLDSVGIDTWGVDYGRLDAAGELMEPPFHYRDSRTDGVPDRLSAEAIPAEELYRRCGLQVNNFNTIYQLVAQSADPRWDEVAHLLFTPDLINYRLTGTMAAEMTMASTSGLLDVATRTWNRATLEDLQRHYGLPLARVLGGLVEPGTVLADTLPGVLGTPTPVVCVASHDTASAVLSVPADSQDFAFVSSGTWSLVGLETSDPVVTEASRLADFTNEAGYGAVMYLRNIMGLWVLMESMRTWEAAGNQQDLPDLLRRAAGLPALRCVLDMADQRLLPPGDMPARLAQMARETGQPVPAEPAEFARCIMDSLALAYRVTIRTACELTGRSIDVVHIVGGGCQNALLCQLTAEATGLPVEAGPNEGTALGNLLVQAAATGALPPDPVALRRVARASSQLVDYRPGVLGLGEREWEDAARRALRNATS